MPFVNESGNADLEYLSDGMTETLISSLSQLPNLGVKPRSSVFRYKGKETNPQTIGKELNVQAILNGRVVQRGQELSLFVELSDISADKVVWSHRYDRQQSDLVTLQSDIARDVSSKLKSKLSGAEVAKVEKIFTANPDAYQLYLKGRYYWNKRTAESLQQAVEFFNQAVDKDPNYALAYSGLAESYVLFPNYSVAMPRDCMPKAKAAALRAIALDDSLAETHVALGIYYSNFAWNLPVAEKHFRRAIELNPNYAPAHQQFGIECLAVMGRFDEAIAEGKRAEELDALSPIIGADLGNILMRARRFEEALAQLNRVLALDPNFSVTYWYLGMTRYGQGQYPEAVSEYRKALAFNDNPWVKALLVQSLAKAGQRNEAAKLLGELEADSGRRYVPNSSLALAYGALGKKDKAFALLDKEIDERGSRPVVFSVNPIWDDLRDDPRFADLLRRVEAAKLE
jgi:TolB-like protein/Tfp pilus assembly protein PilF